MVRTYIENIVYEGKTKDTFEAYNEKILLWIRRINLILESKGNAE
jgi:hypothetical protein